MEEEAFAFGEQAGRSWEARGWILGSLGVPESNKLLCDPIPFSLLCVAGPALRELLGFRQRGKDGPLASWIHGCCCLLEEPWASVLGHLRPRCRTSPQRMRGAERSLVTVGRSFTVAKGFVPLWGIG